MTDDMPEVCPQSIRAWEQERELAELSRIIHRMRAENDAAWGRVHELHDINAELRARLAAAESNRETA